jgi:hypothetical protein
MAIVLRNEGSKINSNINVTPMVDVMLVADEYDIRAFKECWLGGQRFC